MKKAASLSEVGFSPDAKHHIFTSLPGAEPSQSTRRHTKVSVVGCGNFGMVVPQTILTQDISDEIAHVNAQPDKLRREMLDLQQAAAFLPRVNQENKQAPVSSFCSQRCNIEIQNYPSMAEEENKWAGLITDIFNLIYSKIPPDPFIFSSLRGVCRSWRSHDFLAKPPPKFPWLLECKRGLVLSSVGNCLQRHLTYYSLANKETHSLRVPEAFQGKIFHGPGHGYLLVSSSQELTLVNPLTGDLISLPPLDHAFRTLRPVCGGSDPPLQNWHLQLGFSPSTRVFESKAAIYHHNEEERWTYASDCSRNTCYCDGRLYSLKGNRYTNVYDASSGDSLYANSIKPPVDDIAAGVMATYLVESNGGILRITRFLDLSSQSIIKIEDSKFQIHKLNSDQETNPWVKVTDIGDRILFLDLASGFSLKAPAGIKGNCIYFLANDNFSNISPYRYDIGTSTVERLPCPFQRCTWFIPSLE